MCGIAGIYRFAKNDRVDEDLLGRMLEVQKHRGPDGNGIHVGPGYGLVHLRLAIVDLSETGRQPMRDASSRIWITFNGEIYNHLELRRELEAQGRRFVSRSDTEVLIHGWDVWGTDLPRRLRGMFAFAIVDERDHTFFCARDRLGKKPVHYVVDETGVAFASEVKGLLVDPKVSRAIDPEALATFFCLRYVPDPKTIFRDVKKLPPAHWMLVRGGKVSLERYWQVSFATTSQADEKALAEETLARLDDAVRVRLMADVPVGAFLSGGIDSQAVVESMARASTDKVVACTIGFSEGEFDERPHARAAAARYGAVLHEGVVSPEEMLDFAWFENTFDEPFSDSSAVPTYHVSRIARRHVTVALSGDGGDESFAGYRRYRFDRAENRIRRILPGALWRGLGALYPKADFLPRILRMKRTLQNLGRTPDLAYARSVSASLPEEVLPLLAPRLGLRDFDPLGVVRAAYQEADGDDPLSRAVAADLATWLPGDILVKVDRASMAVSLEVRAPFLDHQLVEFAARIPPALKLAGGQTKAFLRKALAARLDAVTLQRTKRGFSVPLRAWLQGPVGDALARALGEGSLAAYVDLTRARELLQRHRSGMHDHSELLWALFCLDRFVRRWTGGGR